MLVLEMRTHTRLTDYSSYELEVSPNSTMLHKGSTHYSSSERFGSDICRVDGVDGKIQRHITMQLMRKYSVHSIDDAEVKVDPGHFREMSIRRGLHAPTQS